jgi:hypothetical protein
VNGVVSVAEPDAGEGVPLVQLTLTLTDAPLFGEKSLLTVNVALFSVFVIVQEALPPTVIATFAHVAWLTVYPAGAVSVAVHVAPTVKPVIVVENGVASEAVPDAGEGVPVVQVTLTGTVAPLFGAKSLCTASVALFSVLVIVQLPLPEGAPLIVPLQVAVDVYPVGIGDSVAVQEAPGV